jgi:hypothetical protein
MSQQGEVSRRGTTIFYRNGGYQRRPTYAEALGNSHHHVANHGSRQGQGISYEERARTLHQPRGEAGPYRVQPREVANHRSHQGQGISYEERVRTLRQPWVGAGPNRGQPREAENIPSDTGVQNLGKLLFQNCQLMQSGRNWKQLPRSINHQLDRVFDNIRPPQGSQELSEDLRNVNKDCKAGLTTTMMNHIEKRRQALMEEILKHREGDFDEAALWARKRTLDHFGQRVAWSEVNEWLREVCTMVTGKSVGGRSQGTGDVAVVVNNNTATTPSGEWARSSQKRGRAEDRESTEGINRFSPLLELEEDGNTDTVPPSTRKTPKKPRLRKNTTRTPLAGNTVIMDVEDVPEINQVAEEDQTIIPYDITTAEAVIKEGMVIRKPTDVFEVERTEISGDVITSGITVEIHKPADVTEVERSDIPCDVITSETTVEVHKLTEVTEVERAESPCDIITSEITVEEDLRLPESTGTTNEEQAVVPEDAGAGDISDEEGTEEEETEVQIETSAGETPSKSKRMSLSQPLVGSIRTNLSTKTNWRLPASVSGKVVLLTDENTDRTTGPIPPDWECHILPKANIRDITNIIERLDASFKIRSIVTSVGWHNGGRAMDDIRKVINELDCAARKRKIDLHFLGVHNQRNQPESSGIKLVNDFAAKKFGGNYIKPGLHNGVSENIPTLSDLVNVVNKHFLALGRNTQRRDF